MDAALSSSRGCGDLWYKMSKLAARGMGLKGISSLEVGFRPHVGQATEVTCLSEVGTACSSLFQAPRRRGNNYRTFRRKRGRMLGVADWLVRFESLKNRDRLTTCWSNKDLCVMIREKISIIVSTSPGWKVEFARPNLPAPIINECHQFISTFSPWKKETYQFKGRTPEKPFSVFLILRRLLDLEQETEG